MIDKALLLVGGLILAILLTALTQRGIDASRLSPMGAVQAVLDQAARR